MAEESENVTTEATPEVTGTTLLGVSSASEDTPIENEASTDNVTKEGEDKVTTEETKTDETQSTVPTEASAYDFGELVPEDLAKQDPELEKRIKDFMFNSAVPQELAKTLAESYIKDHLDATKEFSEAQSLKEQQDKEAFDARVNEFKEEMGSDAKFKTAISRVNKLVGESNISQEELDKDGFSSSIVAIKLINKILDSQGESTITTEGNVSSTSIDDQIDELQKGGFDGAYYNSRHPDHKMVLKKVNDLLDRKAKLTN